jgi:hypothetical protein
MILLQIGMFQKTARYSGGIGLANHMRMGPRGAGIALE